MDINITSLLELDMFTFAHSIAEGGYNAGPDTWNAAKEDTKDRKPPLLDTEEKLEAFRDWIGQSGGWTRDEISAWDSVECDALFLQWIAGGVRQCPATLEEIDFEERFPGMWYFQTPKDKAEDMEDGPHDTRSDAYKVASDELVGVHQTRRAESLDEIDWPEYEKRAEEGRISGYLYRAADGQIYFTLSN